MSTTDPNEEALHVAAPLSMEYPQFTRAQAPTGSNAESAWIGEIQPFTSDNSARAFLQDIEQGKRIWLSGGRMKESLHTKAHWADPLLTDMSVRCKVLVLIQPDPAHPRAYLLDPLYPEHYGFVHPHQRSDLQIEWENNKVPGLCIYSAAEFIYDPQRDRNSQFLDQLALFVARHLIWLRTRQLFRGFPPKGELLRVLRPGEVLEDDRPKMVWAATGSERPVYQYWAGYWPGPTAQAFDTITHLRTIQPHKQCWCGSGIKYQDCHRPAELAGAKRARQVKGSAF